MKQLYEENEHVIPMIWQGDTENQSPGNAIRKGLYGVGAIPHAQFQGTIEDVGGGSTYPRYLNHYNSVINTDSPVDIQLDLNFNSSGQLLVNANINLTGDITTTNNKLVYVLTRNITSDYFCSVCGYGDEIFSLTNEGESGTFEHAFDLDDSWSLGDLKAIVLIQSMNNKYILQGESTGFTGLVPLFSTNVTQGPANLGVQFNNHSMPDVGIDSFEWDFDGDGAYDSAEENPYHLYEEPGIYTVRLRITDGPDVEEIVREDYIIVSAGDNIEGNLSGIWTSEFSPYNVQSDVMIAENDQLIIQPGVEIIFSENSSFLINGTINAEGTAESPIELTSEIFWSGLEFLYNENQNLVKFCKISNVEGSAIKIGYSKVDIISNTIFDNNSANAGAAIDLISSDDVLIQNNFIRNNYSNNATGGILCSSSSPLISNNIIVNNSANLSTPNTSGAMVMKNSSNATIINNTISHNTGNNCIFIIGSAPVFENCIIRQENTLIFEIAGSSSVNYSCLSSSMDGTGNITADPLFEQESAGYGYEYDGFGGLWYLQNDSPCIDAGNPDSIYNDNEDENNPGNPLWPAMGSLTNDIGAFGGVGFDSIESFVFFQNDVVDAEQFSLSNYPNPFNPTTTFSFYLPDNTVSNAQILIYNIKGQRIRVLDIYHEKSGKNSIVWDGKDDRKNTVSSGIYYYKLFLNGKTEQIKKCLLLK